MPRDDAKLYVLDTSVLLHDPDCINMLSKNNLVVIPGPVLQELSDLAHDAHSENKQYLAREATRAIDEYDQQGSLTSEQGVPTKSGGFLRIETRSRRPKELPTGFNSNQRDNQILLVARYLHKQNREGRESERRKVILISKDTNLRHRATAFGLPAEDYCSDKVDNFMTALSSGVTTLALKGGDEAILTRLYHERVLNLADLGDTISEEQVDRLYENQCVFLTIPNGKHAQAIFKKDRGAFCIVKPLKDYDGKRDQIVPRNELQAFAVGLLDDPDIGIVTLIGIAGAGKTLLALKWAYDKVFGHNGTASNGFERIIVFRSNVEAGRRLGFLPGDIDEKFGPWKDPIHTALELITKNRVRGKGDGKWQEREGQNHVIEQIEAEKKLVVMPPNFTRGATYHNTIIIIDDAQNLTMKLIQLLITRVGENSRVIITGDHTQIDDPHLDPASCGLVQAAIRFRGKPMCASLYMHASERSKIAELAAQLLN